MARIRTTKPEFWTREDVLSVSIPAIMLYQGMENFADDEGNIEGGHKSIKTKIFPDRDVEITPLTEELKSQNMIIPYYVNGQSYYNLRTFKEDQKIDKRALPRCPKYDDGSPNPPDLSPLPPEPLQDPPTEGKGGEGSGRELKPIEHPEPDAPNSRNNFEWLWNEYPEKKGKEKAWFKFKAQIKSPEDYENICVALANYKNDVKRIRLNGQPDLRWQYGSTWFHSNWKDYVDYRPPPQPAKVVGGLPLPDVEPSGHNDLADKIKDQLVFAEEMLNDDTYQGGALDHDWLNRSVGNMVLEYSERFPKGPMMERFTEQFGLLTNRVMNLGAEK